MLPDKFLQELQLPELLQWWPTQLVWQATYHNLHTNATGPQDTDWQLKAGVHQSQLLLASTSSNHVVTAALCAAAVAAFHVRRMGQQPRDSTCGKASAVGRGEGVAVSQECLTHKLWWKRMTIVEGDTCRSGWQNSQPILGRFSSNQWKL